MSDDLMETPDAAAEAFEGLRADLAKVLAMLEATRAAEVVDYSLTLGKIAQSLAAIEAHPALKQTPASYQQAVTASIDGVRIKLEGEMRKAVDAVTLASREIQRSIGAKREKRAQLEWVLMAGALGLFLGAVAWGQGSGPLARALPAGWRIPETMAAETLNMDRWTAGARLMRVENPVAWSDMLEGAKLEHENDHALQACWTLAHRLGKTQRCTVMVSDGVVGGTPMESQ